MTTMLLAFLAAASAQDLPNSLSADGGFALPWGTEVAVARERLGRHMNASIALYGRASFPSDSDVTRDGVTFAELFDPGLGFGVEADLLTVVDREWSVGGYLSVGWDRFDGVRNVDDFGDTLEPDSMDLLTVLAGAKILGQFDPFFFWEGRMGLGWVHYDAVKADFILGGTRFPDQEFLKASDRLAFELGGRIGMGTQHFAVDFGMGFRVMGGPGRGKDTTNFIDPDPLVTFILELGLMLRF
jgi:hypothetical protein